MHDFRGLDAGGAMKRFLSAKDQARHDVFFLLLLGRWGGRREGLLERVEPLSRSFEKEEK